MELLFFFIIFITITISSFAAPANATHATHASSIPGWSINGTVWYVSWGGGHAVQLGPNGTINQTFRATGDDVLHYVVGFTVAAQNESCHNNITAVNVTLRDSWNDSVWRVMQMQRDSSRDLWERHALYLGQLVEGYYVDIQLQSLAMAMDACWPILDAFIVNTNPQPRWYNGNIVANAGFEVGPTFPANSSGGIILNEEEDDFQSPLQQWKVIGRVRYIDSTHYKVPRGRAAVELLSVSGDPSGVQKELLQSQPPTETFMPTSVCVMLILL